MVVRLRDQFCRERDLGRLGFTRMVDSHRGMGGMRTVGGSGVLVVVCAAPRMLQVENFHVSGGVEAVSLAG